MQRTGYRLPLGLMIRPAARVIRELPPSLAAYRVAVSFHAAPLAALGVVWSTARAKKKAIKSDPGGKTLRFVGDALPHAGSESGLMALIFCLVSTPCAVILTTKSHGVSIATSTNPPTVSPLRMVSDQCLSSTLRTSARPSRPAFMRARALSRSYCLRVGG